MPFKYCDQNKMKIFFFESFPDNEVKHGIFTRRGGVSPVPWSSLNLGGTVGDTRENVVENRRRIFSYINRPVESIFDSWQVHGDHVLCVEKPRSLDASHEKADAILTDKKDITLFMRFADCVPILLYDPTKRVVGIVHAGWQGTVKKIVSVTVKKMVSHYGCEPSDIYAGIGPSIGPHHYDIGKDVADQIQQAFGTDSNTLLIQKNGRLKLDLWKANEISLSESGVHHIETSAVCTACNIEDWFSHRRENGKTGRFAAVITLQ